MHRSTLPIALTAAVVGLGLTALPAAAEERVCKGALGAVTVDNLRVPEGATCTLSGTYVKGTIKVERGATLSASAIRVIGNIQAENHRHVSVIQGSRVDGSLQVKQGGGARIDRSIFGSDVQFFTNSGASASPATGSTATCSARRTAPRRRAARTSCRATERISARGCSPAYERGGHDAPGADGARASHRRRGGARRAARGRPGIVDGLAQAGVDATGRRRRDHPGGRRAGSEGRRRGGGLHPEGLRPDSHHARHRGARGGAQQGGSDARLSARRIARSR